MLNNYKHKLLLTQSGGQFPQMKSNQIPGKINLHDYYFCNRAYAVILLSVDAELTMCHTIYGCMKLWCIPEK